MNEYRFRIEFSSGHGFNYSIRAENEKDAFKKIREVYPCAQIERIK